MQSTNLRQIKQAIWNQAFLGNHTRVTCPMGPVVAVRRRKGHLLALIRGWGRWYSVESVSIYWVRAMRERLNSLLSEAGERFDYLKSDIRNLSRYMAELEELVEGYRTFAAAATLSTRADQKAIQKLLKRTHKLLGPVPSAEGADEPDCCQQHMVQ